MHKSKQSVKSYNFSIDLGIIKSNMIRSQSKIYKASKSYQSRTLYKCQKEYMCNRITLLVAIKRTMYVIKKKLMHTILTAASF